MDFKALGWECVDWGQGVTLATCYCLAPSLRMYRTVPKLPHVPLFHR